MPKAKNPSKAALSDAAIEEEALRRECAELYGWAAKLLTEYVKYELVPRHFAEARRKAGDPSASPRDYACGCPLAADMKPNCFEMRPGCKFIDRAVTKPFYCNDPLRHDAFRAIYLPLLDRVLGMGDNPMTAEEAAALLGRIEDWRERRERSRR
ncbi:MAG: hypothetical protein R3C58_03650 [Parvularculaceae bacterium]